jgi:hypothetical protein
LIVASGTHKRAFKATVQQQQPNGYDRPATTRRSQFAGGGMCANRVPRGTRPHERLIRCTVTQHRAAFEPGSFGRTLIARLTRANPSSLSTRLGLVWSLVNGPNKQQSPRGDFSGAATLPGPIPVQQFNFANHRSPSANSTAIAQRLLNV